MVGNDIQSFSSEIKLSHGSRFQNGVLYVTYNYGYFCIYTKCLANLVELYENYNISPVRIDFSECFDCFKTQEQLDNKVDMYPLLFQGNKISEELQTNVVIDSHALYTKQNIRKLAPWVKKYFSPANLIMALQSQIIHKYNIDPANTLVFCMRGTDKWTEIRSATADVYFNKCKTILRKNPNLRVWVQTDQQQYRDYLLREFGDRAFAIDELPVMQGGVILHHEQNLKFDRFKFGQYLLATMNLVARCNTVITHTGNLAYWQALYRGDTNNFFQDTPHFYGGRKIGKEGKFGRLSFGAKVKKVQRSINIFVEKLVVSCVKIFNYMAKLLLSKEIKVDHLRISKIIYFTGRENRDRMVRFFSFLQLKRIDRNNLTWKADEILLFTHIKNELPRLADFLKYYRERGIDKFFIVDNNSSDGTIEYLLKQKDVYLFHTKESFARAKIGLCWRQKLLGRYGLNKWCLLVDIDEFLIYPHWEEMSIKDLCCFLSTEKATAFRADLLDMYAKDFLPLQDGDNQSLWNIYEYYDTYSSSFYEVSNDELENMEWVHGGVRGRVFNVNPLLTKVPMIKYTKNVGLTGGMHQVHNVIYSQVKGSLFHFKYDASFFNKVSEAVKSEEYWDRSREYKTIHNKACELTITSLYSSKYSVRFENSQQLIREGIMKTSEELDRFVRPGH